MNGMIAANAQAIAIAGYNPHTQFRPGGFKPAGYGCGSAMNASACHKYSYNRETGCCSQCR